MSLISLAKAGVVSFLGYAAFQGVNALQNRKIIVDEANLYISKEFTIIVTAAAALYFVAEAYGNYAYPKDDQVELRNREIKNCFGCSCVMLIAIAYLACGIASVEAAGQGWDD